MPDALATPWPCAPMAMATGKENATTPTSGKENKKLKSAEKKAEAAEEKIASLRDRLAATAGECERLRREAGKRARALDREKNARQEAEGKVRVRREGGCALCCPPRAHRFLCLPSQAASRTRAGLSNSSPLKSLARMRRGAADVGVCVSQRRVLRQNPQCRQKSVRNESAPKRLFPPAGGPQPSAPPAMNETHVHANRLARTAATHRSVSLPSVKAS